MVLPSAGLNSLQTLSLDVKYGPRMGDLQPVNVKEQESVQMVCNVSSNPVSTITWYRGSERLGSALGEALTLNISNITARDQGNYTCRAHNRIGQATQTVPITVQSPPRIHWMGGSVGVLDGTLFRQDCVVDSYPVSNTSWRRGSRILNESVSNTLTLVIPTMGKGDSDLYTCSSINPFGNASQSLHIRLEYSPRNISITLDHHEALNASIEMSEGESVSLLCTVDSEPMANLSWTLDGEIRNASPWSARLWLTIPNVTYQDHGLHTCTAHNPHGASQRSLTINVNYSPKEVSVLVPAGDTGIREGCDVTLRCQCESHPPARNYSWIRKVPGHPPRVIGVRETLTLRSVSRRESAVFFCRVSNDLGSGESAPFHLNVEYGPEISRESKCAERAEGITCVCAANSNPPAVITWHLPHANLSGNQTHGGFVSEQLREGHLVKGFLILTGHQDEEEVVVSCSVRNPHGASLFKVYLWGKGEGHLVNLVLAVIVGALAMLVLMLSLCLISLFCKRKTKDHVIEGSEMEELTVQPPTDRPGIGVNPDLQTQSRRE
ncbi:sialic acid-binding Ig-like lectin 10 [Chiloscyllium punctatum]|uniref:sialic acid-binding Ig-like lectin 10 n=1 Tax=Chiloscyllium punctatum TaxID=137246 RepID=UPI003B6376F5